MPSITSTVLILASILSTSATASPPQSLSVEALPTDLDTNLWVPFTTIYSTFTPSVTAEAIPASTTQDLQIQERQVTGQGAAAAIPVTPTQVSPITTYGIGIVDRAGVHQWVQVVYTQTFPKIPDQWESPQTGTIGMGTIEGKIGVIKTKRGIEIEVPLPTSPVAPEAVLQVETLHGSKQDADGGDTSSDVPDLEVREATNGSVRSVGSIVTSVLFTVIGFSLATMLLL